MNDRISQTQSKQQDAATPLNSVGGYKNATGDFNLLKNLIRKVKSRRDLDQPKFTEDDAQKRYYGDFSIESKRHVWDLLDKHPKFDRKGQMQMNRIQNNTKDVIGGVTKTSDTYY